MFVSGKVNSTRLLGLATTWNVDTAYSVRSYMEFHVTDQAAAVISRKGGTAVVDLLEPFG